MNKKHIFFDTNIIQHCIQNENKESILTLHKSNISYYNKSNIYLLPQVICEIMEHNINYQDGIWAFLKIELLDDFKEFNLQITNDIFENIFLLWTKKPHNYRSYIANSIYYLENFYSNLPDFTEKIKVIKTIAIERFWINFKANTTAENIWNVLAEVIEGTAFWNKTYHQFTYKDIFRCVGNFMFDFKNYKLKGVKQKTKIGKDSQIVLELCMWITLLWVDLAKDEIVFISSDYPFIKELKKFKKALVSGDLIKDRNYSDLSSFFTSQLHDIFSTITILKLNITKCVFEDEYWKENVLISSLI